MSLFDSKDIFFSSVKFPISNGILPESTYFILHSLVDKELLRKYFVDVDEQNSTSLPSSQFCQPNSMGLKSVGGDELWD